MTWRIAGPPGPVPFGRRAMQARGDQMRRRLAASAAIGVAALCTLAGCGSSGNSAGTTTLTLFGADYGTGPANSTTKYWNAIATAFHKANPGITVRVQTVNW